MFPDVNVASGNRLNEYNSPLIRVACGDVMLS